MHTHKVMRLLPSGDPFILEYDGNEIVACVPDGGMTEELMRETAEDFTGVDFRLGEEWQSWAEWARRQQWQAIL